MRQVKAKPFLKWAGGKTRLVPTLARLIPSTIRTYYEPFLGGGALYYHLGNDGRFSHAVLNDFNPELVNCYRVVRDFTDELIGQLSKLEIRQEVFYELRNADPMTFSPVRRAARTLFLNRTCFNGLYRLNSKGLFNVPWGRHKNPRIVDEGNLRACGALLNQSTSLLTGDFSEAVRDAREGDTVYFDPPYVPLSATSNFESYTKDGFNLEDQRRLAQCVRDLAAKGVRVLVSNSDTPIVRELYAGFEIRVVRMRRNINANANSRGPVDEVVVLTHPVPDILDLARETP